MDVSIIALAIEALERRKEAIQAEIDALRGAKGAGPRSAKRSAAVRRPRAVKSEGTARKPGPQSAAARKAISERMKAYWAKRRAGKTKARNRKQRLVKPPEEGSKGSK